MGKKTSIVLYIAFVVILLFTLPFLYVMIIGAIDGSFQWYPNPDDIALHRTIFIICAVFIVLIDVVLGMGILKTMKIIFTKKEKRS